MLQKTIRTIDSKEICMKNDRFLKATYFFLFVMIMISAMVSNASAGVCHYENGFYSDSIDGPYYDHGNGTVSDIKTGLLWQQTEAPLQYSWDRAIAYCDNLTLADYTDWRLPDLCQLQSLLDRSQTPKINTTYFPNAQMRPYWSWDVVSYNPNYAWYADFSNAYVGSGYQVYENCVRCVRYDDTNPPNPDAPVIPDPPDPKPDDPNIPDPPDPAPGEPVFDDVVGTWRFEGQCTSTTDTGFFKFYENGTFDGKMTDESQNSWDETGVYQVNGNVVTLTSPDNIRLSFTFESSEKMVGRNFDCYDVFYKISDDNNNLDPLAITLDAFPFSGQPPLSVNYSVQISGGIPPYIIEWAFGDGMTAMGVGESATHTYIEGGNYTALAMITDSAGNQASEIVQIAVDDVEPLLITINAIPLLGNAPIEVIFDSQSSGGVQPYIIEWVFGDGTTGSGEKTSHTYETGGSYNAVVTVTDDQGNNASDSVQIVVEDPTHLIAPNLTVTTQGGRVTLSWDEVPETEGYYLWFCLIGDNNEFDLSTLINFDLKNITTESYDLNADASFAVAIQPYNKDESGPISNLEYILLEKDIGVIGNWKNDSNENLMVFSEDGSYSVTDSEKRCQHSGRYFANSVNETISFNVDTSNCYDQSVNAFLNGTYQLPSEEALITIIETKQQNWSSVIEIKENGLIISGKVFKDFITNSDVYITNLSNSQLLGSTTVDENGEWSIPINSEEINGDENLLLTAMNPENELEMHSLINSSNIPNMGTFTSDTTTISHYTEAAWQLADTKQVRFPAQYLANNIELTSLGYPLETSNEEINELAEWIRTNYFHTGAQNSNRYRVELLSEIIELLWPSLLVSDTEIDIKFPSNLISSGLDIEVINIVTNDNIIKTEEGIRVTVPPKTGDGNGQIELMITGDNFQKPLTLSFYVMGKLKEAESIVTSDGKITAELDELLVSAAAYSLPDSTVLTVYKIETEDILPIKFGTPLATFNIQAENELEAPVTLTYTVPVDQDHEKIVLHHLQPSTGTTELIYSDSFDADTRELNFSVDSFSLFTLTSKDEEYNLGTIFTIDDLKDNPDEAFTFLSKQVDFLYDHAKDSKALDPDKKNGKCAAILVSEAINSFMKIAKDGDTLDELENKIYGGWFGVFQKNSATTFLDIYFRFKNALILLNNNHTLNLFSVESLSDPIYEYLNGGSYWASDLTKGDVERIAGGDNCYFGLLSFYLIDQLSPVANEQNMASEVNWFREQGYSNEMISNYVKQKKLEWLKLAPVVYSSDEIRECLDLFLSIAKFKAYKTVLEDNMNSPFLMIPGIIPELAETIGQLNMTTGIKDDVLIPALENTISAARSDTIRKSLWFEYSIDTESDCSGGSSIDVFIPEALSRRLKKIDELVESLNTIRFVNNGDGTVTDNETGLMWEQGYGKGYYVNIHSHPNISLYPESLNRNKFAGYTNWRLPNKDELKSLVVCTNGKPTPLSDDYDDSCGGDNWGKYESPTINFVFPHDSEEDIRMFYTGQIAPESHAKVNYVIFFKDGRLSYADSAGSVRCVRNP